ncbi:hypothetical protein Chor_002204 [Crotalus horridus]
MINLLDTMESGWFSTNKTVLFLLSVLCAAGKEAWAQGAIFKSRLFTIFPAFFFSLPEKIFWVHNRAFGQENFPVILSIQGGKSCLACSPGSPPELQLESIYITDLCKDKEASTRFTFFVANKDGIWRFESAANPGWFLCTSSKANEPLGLIKNPGSSHLVDFYFQPES